jgi:hypothetical protein
MADLYAKLNPKVVVARDSGYKQRLWERTDETLNQIVRTDLAEQSSGVLVVPVDGTQAVPFGTVTAAAILLLQSSQECRVTLDGGDEYLTIKGSGSYPGLLLLHGDVASATVENMGTAAAEVDYLVVGD